MTGSLQIKKDTYYTVIYTRVDGRKHYAWKSTGLTVSRNNKRAAEKILKERIADLEQLDFSRDADQLFSEFMKEWLSIIRLTVKENTYYQYKLIVQNSIVPFFEPMKIKLFELKPQHIQRFYTKKLDEGVSGSTVRRYHANIRKALRFAVTQNRILHNPADRVVLPKENPPKNNFYTTEELKYILELVRGTNIETPVLLAATYGFRRSEVIGLKWDAIDFDHHTITIKHTVTGTGNRQVKGDTTKTTRSRRTIYLLPELEAYLLSLKEHQECMKAFFGVQFEESDYICTWDDGRLMSPEYVSRKFKTILQTSNLPVYRFHDLRHSSASLLIKYGYSLKEVGEWLGHSSVVSTNRYAHLQHQATINMANTVAQDILFKVG